MLLLSGYSRNLETNTKMFSLSFKYLIYFIKKVLGIKTKGVLMYWVTQENSIEETVSTIE